jgi:hypothetical protein
MKNMVDALVMLYQSVNLYHKMLQMNKLTSADMSKTDMIASYIMKITKLRNQLVAIGERIGESEVVWITLNGFVPSWHHFV